MSKQPEALRLADSLTELDAQFSFPGACGEAAAELRNLHAANVQTLDLLDQALADVADLRAQVERLQATARVLPPHFKGEDWGVVDAYRVMSVLAEHNKNAEAIHAKHEQAIDGDDDGPEHNAAAFEMAQHWNRFTQKLTRLVRMTATPQPSPAPVAAVTAMVPLTDEQIFNLYCKSDSVMDTHITNLVAFARAIEEAHGIGLTLGAQANKEAP